MRRFTPLRRKQPLPPRKKPINKVSKGLAAELKLYNENERPEFLKENPLCMIRRPGCGYYATKVHHSKGRGPYLRDKSTFIGTCESPNCHGWVEEHPEEAKELNFSQDRLTKNVIQLNDNFKDLPNE